MVEVAVRAPSCSAVSVELLGSRIGRVMTILSPRGRALVRTTRLVAMLSV